MMNDRGIGRGCGRGGVMNHSHGFSVDNSGPHRSSTATGSAGPVGASFAVIEKNWHCSSCNAENLVRAKSCVRCRARKPKGGGGKDWHAGAVALAGGADHGWREALDPATKQLYYYHAASGRTSWNRPTEMGTALSATGWYGRGKAGSMAQAKLDETNSKHLKRPAMRQVDETLAKNVSYLQGTENFNIYYGKYNGEHWSRNKSPTEPAKTRCNVALHAGWTQADKRSSDTNKPSYFCIMWCKGGCFKGKKCGYFHRVPVYADVGRLEKDMMHDVFGRERHATNREDMQGVGSFNDPCRTLYVGKLQRTPYADKPKELEKVLDKHFGEFGEVEHINVIWDKAIAFVRFRFRTHAELAKEALACQTLDHDEILDVRWAHEDPNPVAKEAMRRANADAVAAAIKAAGLATAQVSFTLPAGYNPKTKTETTAAIAEKSTTNTSSSSSSLAKAIEDQPNLTYPNTDAQYVNTQATEPAVKRIKHNS